MKYCNNNTSDNTYDDEIKGKIDNVKIILSRLGNIVTKNDRKKIEKELYEIKKSRTFQIMKNKDLCSSCRISKYSQ